MLVDVITMKELVVLGVRVIRIVVFGVSDFWKR